MSEVTSIPELARATFLLGVGACLAAACTNDFGQFDFAGGAGGGGLFPPVTSTTGGAGPGGMGGAGGATVTTTSTGGAGGCTSPLMCPGPDTDCQQRACVNETCGFDRRPPGSACNDDGGQVCDGLGSCVQCLSDADCIGITDGACGLSNTCLPPSCSDTILNGQETAADCGGPTCDPCANTLACLVDSDCASNLCVANVCTACTDDADCATVPDTWCDAGACAPLKAAGDPCGGDNECTSNFCPGDDGLCCDTACDQSCESCQMADTGVADGICGAVMAGMDPTNDCALDPLLCTGDACSGTAGLCEAGAAGQTCRMSMGSCDAAETCDGVNVGCPADGKLSNLTICRASMGDCDVAETCDGMSNDCPTDEKLDGTTTCRPANGVCDVAEVCDGTSDACPVDAKEPGTTSCRGAVDTCDAEEFCTGVSDDCPADVKRPMGFVCNPSQGGCDPAETCDGSSDACPSDVIASPGTPCGTVAGPCDAVEFCDGTNVTCPTDELVPDGGVSNGGACGDYFCDGAVASCPTSCAGDGDCIAPATCDGTMMCAP